MSRLRSAWPLRHVMLPSCLTSIVSFGALVCLACSSSSSPGSANGAPPDPGSSCTPIVATGASTTASGAATCSASGEATSGARDAHCATADGGLTVQSTSAAACCVMGEAGGPGQCPYAATMYGHEGDDDDCKYHVTWTSTPLCESAAGVQFTVTATYLGTGRPVTGANVRPEVFVTNPAANDAGCDDMSSHESPSTYTVFAESTPGTYVGRVVFDAPGAWTARFHLFENCYDVRDDSPHGHAAFHVTVP